MDLEVFKVKYHLACCAVPFGETVDVLYREIPTSASTASDTRLTAHFFEKPIKPIF
jgi:hypothetical protein